jgi:hypothetical protein
MTADGRRASAFSKASGRFASAHVMKPHPMRALPAFAHSLSI